MIQKKYAHTLIDMPLKTAISERYLSYALSTITSRSLPDVRDGLKPVHRRLLFAMMELKLNPGLGYKKCARIVGDVMGKYHPHGDSSIYEAMVRLAQDFSVRYPLVDGQGNFGNIDGDNAAAMRYTEARMTKFAQDMLRGIDQDTVNFRDTYDGEGAEPVVLPSAVPNLLANGSSGIAVGMATNIPPHNVSEICDALLHVIKFPNASIDKLIDFVKGPDFPTGGVLVENRQTIVDTYTSGRGSMRIRAKWEKEDLGKGLWQVVITDIPYQVQKSRLIEKIADIIEEKKVPILADVRDESAEDLRLVLEPRTRNVDPATMMQALFKYTDLETRFALNMNVLCDKGRVPKVLNLREVLIEYLDHRHEVLVRRSQYRKGQIERRLEILNGYLVAFLNLDEVIRIIREDDDAKKSLMSTFNLSDVQTDAILNMRLRSLRRLEEMELKAEYTKLKDELAGINALLVNEKDRWSIIASEVKQTKLDYGLNTEFGARRTEIGEAPSDIEIPLESMIEKEPVTVVCSKNGWVRALKGHITDTSDIKYKEGDEEHFVFKVQTTDKILVMTTSGRFYTLIADKLPSGRGNGEPLSIMFDLQQGDSIVCMRVYRAGQKLLVASSDSRGFIVQEDGVIAQTKNGKQIITPSKGEKATICTDATGDSVAVVGSSRKLLVFGIEEMPEMSRGRGVILQKYKDAKLSDVKVFNRSEGLSWPAGKNRTRIETELTGWVGRRASIGKIPPVGFPKNNKLH